MLLSSPVLYEIYSFAKSLFFCKISTLFLCAAAGLYAWFRFNTFTGQQISGITQPNDNFRAFISPSTTPPEVPGSTLRYILTGEIFNNMFKTKRHG